MIMGHVKPIDERRCSRLSPSNSFLRPAASTDSIRFLFIRVVHTVCMCSITSNSVNGLTRTLQVYTYPHRKPTNGRKDQEGENIISRSIQDNNKRLPVLGAANARREVRSVVKGSSWLKVILYLPREKRLLNFQATAATGQVIQCPGLYRCRLGWRTDSQSLTRKEIITFLSFYLV